MACCCTVGSVCAVKLQKPDGSERTVSLTRMATHEVYDIKVSLPRFDSGVLSRFHQCGSKAVAAVLVVEGTASLLRRRGNTDAGNTHTNCTDVGS